MALDECVYSEKGEMITRVRKRERAVRSLYENGIWRYSDRECFTSIGRIS